MWLGVRVEVSDSLALVRAGTCLATTTFLVIVAKSVILFSVCEVESLNLNDHLAKVLTTKKPKKCGSRIVQANNHCFTAFDFA